MYSPKEHSRMVDLSNLFLFWDTWHILKCSRWASSLFRPGERRGSSIGEEQAHQMKKGCRNGEAKEGKDILCVSTPPMLKRHIKRMALPNLPSPSPPVWCWYCTKNKKKCQRKWGWYQSNNKPSACQVQNTSIQRANPWVGSLKAQGDLWPLLHRRLLGGSLSDGMGFAWMVSSRLLQVGGGEGIILNSRRDCDLEISGSLVVDGNDGGGSMEGVVWEDGPSVWSLVMCPNILSKDSPHIRRVASGTLYTQKREHGEELQYLTVV